MPSKPAEKYSARSSGLLRSLVSPFRCEMLVYRAKWKTGEVTLIAATTSDLQDVLDQIGDPDDVELEPFDGPLLVTISADRKTAKLEPCDETRKMLDAIDAD